jgi:hypothetical protein
MKKNRILAGLIGFGILISTVLSVSSYEYKGLVFSDEKMEAFAKQVYKPYYDFLPKEYVVDTCQVQKVMSFTSEVSVNTVNGYVFNENDFPELNIKEIIFYTEDQQQVYNTRLIFYSFEDAWNSVPVLEANSDISSVNGVFIGSGDIPQVEVTLETLPDIMTAEQIIEKSDEICEAFEITEEELFELCGITQAEPPTEIAVDPTLSADIDNSGNVQLNDIVFLSQAISAENIDDVLCPQGKANADVYADGKIDSTDLSVFANAMVNSKLADLPKLPE